jgi:hypothetical protein
MKIAMSGNVTKDFYIAMYALIGLKLLATVAQFAWMRGNYRKVPQSIAFRVIYVTGKVTPALAVTCGFVYSVLRHDVAHGWFYGCFALFAAWSAWYVVRLRKQGRFYGLADVFSRNK